MKNFLFFFKVFIENSSFFGNNASLDRSLIQGGSAIYIEANLESMFILKRNYFKVLNFLVTTSKFLIGQ